MLLLSFDLFELTTIGSHKRTFVFFITSESFWCFVAYPTVSSKSSRLKSLIVNNEASLKYTLNYNQIDFTG